MNFTFSVKPTNESEEFIYDFLLGVGNLDNISMETASYTSLLKTMIPKKSITFAQLFRTLVIGLYAWKREADKTLLGIESTNRENNSLEILAALLNGIVSGMSEAKELLTSPFLAHCELLENICFT